MLEKLKAIRKKKKIPETSGGILCSFPIWFPSAFQMSFFHNSGHLITAGIVKDTERSPLQPTGHMLCSKAFIFGDQKRSTRGVYSAENFYLTFEQLCLVLFVSLLRVRNTFSHSRNLSFNIDDVVTDFQQGWEQGLPGLSAHSKLQIFRCVLHPAVPPWV